MIPGAVGGLAAVAAVATCLLDGRPGDARGPAGDDGSYDAVCTARCLRLLDVRSSSGGDHPPAADAGSAVVSDNQPLSLERFKFLQDGSLAWAVSSVNR